jgi:hypothetical protein
VIEWLARPRPIAWVLNLDAEEEFAAQRHYTPTQRFAAIVADQRRRLVAGDPRASGVPEGAELVRPGDLVVDEHTAPGAARGFEGRAWSPTPRALALLERAGAEIGWRVPLDVLRTVNARGFASEVRAPLALEAFAKDAAGDIETLLALVARPSADGWLVRRTFGAAGRGRRRVPSGAPDEPTRAWMLASLAKGPLVVEPWVTVLREATVSGLVGADGRVRVAAPCFQRTTKQGAWLFTDRASAGELERRDDARLLDAAEQAGRALAGAGYAGPFGIDAFHYLAEDRRGAGGRVVLNPLSEINARVTMDWAVAFAAERARASANEPQW